MQTNQEHDMHSKQDVKSIWSSVLTMLKEEISDVSFQTWFEPVEPLSMSSNTLTLGVQSGIYKNMIMTKYYSLIESALVAVAGETYQIEVVCLDEVSNPKPESAPVAAPGKVFNPKFTFSNFVVGNNNSLARAASLAVSENIGNSIHNPLFLYGGSGLGKTHLLHAIANNAQLFHSNLKVVYITTENLMNDYVNALLALTSDKKSVQKFKDKYRNVDLFLVDDIQFVGGRDGFQEEFFHTFNELYDNGRQIVLTSDRLPGEIPKLEERLRTRFNMGLLADVQPPDFEMRIAILKSKIQSEYFDVDDEILRYIAENIRSNVRDLEGAVKKMLLYSSIQRTNRITLELAEQALKDIFQVTKKKLTVASIIDVVEKYFSLPKGSLVSQRRPKSVSYPRQIAMYLCREVADMSLPDIGRDFGGRNHTTVIHAVNKINEDIRTKPETEKTVAILTENVIKN